MIIGVIGCGGIAQAWYGPCLRRMKRRFHLSFAACCDIDPNRRERFADEFGFAHCYADYRDMLAKERLQAVYVLLPPEHACKAALAVMGSGAACLMEKPPGLDRSQIDQLIAGAATHRTPHQVAFNRRFTPALRELKRRLEEAGGAQCLRYEMCRHNRKDTDFTITAIHGIDALRFLLGDDDLGTLDFGYREMAEGCPLYHLQGRSRTGTLLQAAFLPLAGYDRERVVAHTENRSWIVDLPENSFGPGAAGRWREYRDGQMIDSYVTGAKRTIADTLVQCGIEGLNEDFLNALAENRTPSLGFRQTRLSVLVMEAMRKRAPRLEAGFERADKASPATMKSDEEL